MEKFRLQPTVSVLIAALLLAGCSTVENGTDDAARTAEEIERSTRKIEENVERTTRSIREMLCRFHSRC